MLTISGHKGNAIKISPRPLEWLLLWTQTIANVCENAGKMRLYKLLLGM
jgi:hypothetical protein